MPFSSLVFGWRPEPSEGAGGAVLPGLCCVTGLLILFSSRWLWLMPNPTTARFLRETERTIIIACWSQPGPGHSVNMLSCNVGLFQPKTFQVPVTDLYIFIKIYSEIGPMMHVLRTGCSRNPSASPVDLAGCSWAARERLVVSLLPSRPCCLHQGHRGISSLAGLRFALVLVSARYVQNVRNSLHLRCDIAFPKPPIHFVDFTCLWLNDHGNNNNPFFSVLLARKHAYLS